MSIDTHAPAGESPFQEVFPPATEPIGFTQWTGGGSPFADLELGSDFYEESAVTMTEALDAFSDEVFAEALDNLVAETRDVINERFADESATHVAERQRLGDSHLGIVGLEAERYLDSLADRLSGIEVASLSDEQFDNLLDSLDPQASALSPASEEFFGSLIRKAKGAVKFVVSTAKSAAATVGKVAGGLLGPVLQKLRALIRPLLQRVLSFAIGRLPAPLRGPARTLASRLRLEVDGAEQLDYEGAEEEGEAYAAASPTLTTTPEDLAEQFDTAAAEIMSAASDNEEPEAFGAGDSLEESTALERLGEARDELITRIGAADNGEDLAPVIENFIPALLAALRVGINLVGRSRVVSFLAKYVSQLLRAYVGPDLARPLSTAIVDTGLKLVMLEGEVLDEAEAASTALAATVEDTVRRLAESEDFVLEDAGLLQLAAAEAFERAVATNFPTRLVRPAVQQAPSLAGTFVTRHARRRPHPFRKYSRVPEIELTENVANALRTFGGSNLGDELRAAGVSLPLRARMHIYEAITGTTIPAITRADSKLSRLGRGAAPWQRLHPLTPRAAGLLLREPRLGAQVPPTYIASRGRVAVGQRFYWLEPVVGAAMQSTASLVGITGPASRATSGARPLAPRASTARLRIDLRTRSVRLAVYLSEREAQSVATEIRQGRGTPALLAALSRAFQQLRFAAGDRSVVVRREVPQSEDLSARLLGRLAPGVLDAVRRRVREWYLTTAAEWAKTRAEEFARAAADPSDGVTVAVTLSSVPGIGVIAAAVTGKAGAAELRSLLDGSALRGAPAVAVAVKAGRHLR